jgi:hypothetical protein
MQRADCCRCSRAAHACAGESMHTAPKVRHKRIARTACTANARACGLISHCCCRLVNKTSCVAACAAGPKMLPALLAALVGLGPLLGVMGVLQLQVEPLQAQGSTARQNLLEGLGRTACSEKLASKAS